MKFITLIFLLFITSQRYYSQTQSLQDKINEEFNNALMEFNSGKFESALGSFDNILDFYSVNSKTTLLLLFAGKTSFKLNRYPEAKKYLTKLINEYPSSHYVDEALFTLADIYVESGDYSEAADKLIGILTNSLSDDYISSAKLTLEKICLKYFSRTKIDDLYNSQTSNRVRPFLLLLAGKYSLNQKDFSEAEKIFKGVSELYPESEEAVSAKYLAKTAGLLEVNSKLKNLFAVLLPLKEKNSQLQTSNAAADILEGIKFAVSEYNKRTENKVGLLIRNTARDEKEIDHIQAELKDFLSVRALLGPLYSDEVKWTLTKLNSLDIPIVSPTATDNELTSEYENFYQANPPFSIRGKVMAQYIYFVENKRRIAVLRAGAGYSPLLAEAFIQEFTSLGGTVLTEQIYNAGDISMTEQVSKIASFASKLEGIYIPLSDKADVPIILSELVQNNLNVNLYGNQDWFLAKGYETSTSLSNRLIFTSDYYIDYNNKNFKDFSDNFMRQTGVDVSRNILYGYDIAKHLLTALEESLNNNTSLANELKSSIITKGYHSNIAFDEDRENKFLNIVRYKDGLFELIDKFKYSD